MSIVIDKRITGYSVKTPEKANPPPSPMQPSLMDAADPDRRLVLGALPGIAQRSLRFPRRPTDRDGFDAWTSDFIHAPTGKFVVCISQATNGHVFPFEIWSLGSEQPPAASLISQLMSKVLQTDDRPFIRHHLDALKKATEVPFALTLPHTGNVVTANSVSAAIALVYEAHARHVGYLVEDDTYQTSDSPFLMAMSSITEPKSHGAGGVATFDDVRSPTCDFPLFIKEAWVEGTQQPIPISVWAGSKKVPPESEAILKLVSLAMRHRDPSWAATCLLTLKKHVDPGDELGFAKVGTKKPTYYASTWAYVADLVLNRYVQLGILNEDYQTIAQGSLFEDKEPMFGQAAGGTTATSLRPVATNNMKCPDCNTTGSMFLASGCWTCVCGFSRCG